MIPLYWVSPIGMPITVVTRIPISIPPFTFLMTRKAVMARPIRANRPLPSVMEPNIRSVELSFMMIPAF